MRPVSFIYIVSILFASQFTQGEVFTGTNLFGTSLCIAFILLAGVPHGAIDHVLSIKTNQTKASHFYIAYLSIIVLYIALWLLLPLVAVGLFMIVSAYHFGEAHFKDITKDNRTVTAFSFIWGAFVLLAFVGFQYTVLSAEMDTSSTWSHVEPLFTAMSQKWLLFLSAGLLFLTGGLLIKQRVLQLESVIHEVIILFAVLISFRVLDPFLSFTLFFVILHSMRVLRQEYKYLTRQLSGMDAVYFMKLLAPYTLLSIMGITLIYYVNYLWWSLPVLYLALIITSVVTLPHAVVMHFFYKAIGDTTATKTDISEKPAKAEISHRVQFKVQ